MGDEPIGVINVGLAKKVDDLSRAEKETLEQLIGLVTLAVDRAKLYQDLKEANIRLKQLDQLKDEFIVGMLSKEELHPVKGFSENGKMVWVVDEGKMNALKSVDRNEVWYKRNEVKLREFKQIMRHLCPDDPNAGDVEKFRPRNRGVR